MAKRSDPGRAVLLEPAARALVDTLTKEAKLDERGALAAGLVAVAAGLDPEAAARALADTLAGNNTGLAPRSWLRAWSRSSRDWPRTGPRPCWDPPPRRSPTPWLGRPSGTSARNCSRTWRRSSRGCPWTGPRRC